MPAIAPTQPSNDALWAALLENVPFYLGTVSPSGVILSINRLSSARREEVIGKLVTEIAPGANPSFPDALAAILAGAESAQAEFPVPRTAGTRWISCHLVPILVDRQVNSVLVVGFDVTESKQSGAELRMSVNALHRLLEDREELAADLHDGILQSLFGVGLRLEALRGATDPQSTTRPHLDRAIAQLNETMADIRHFITANRSSLAAHSRWEDALAGALRGLEVTGGPSLVVDLDPAAARRVPAADRGELVFIAREAVGNSIRHARANRILVQLTMHDRAVRLEVKDDGRGFRVDDHHTGIGLLTMTRRAGRMGAILTIKSGPETGTLVRIDLAGPSQTE